MTDQLTALITGGSRGFGRALGNELANRNWKIVITGRDAVRLEAAAREIGAAATPVAGDVVDPTHRRALQEIVGGGLDLLVNNASTLGPTPLPALTSVSESALNDVIRTNVIAPLDLVRALLPALRARRGTVVNISSDAAVEAYEGWGAYGLSKAALDHATSVLGVENAEVRFLAFDPGDMRTDMHQAAFPGQDISDRPLPETVVPSLVALVDSDASNGRYRAADLRVDA